MPEFTCKLGTLTGELVEKVVTGKSEQAVKQMFHEQNYHVFSIRKKNSFLSAVASLKPSGSEKIKTHSFLIFNQELAALIRAGLPILQGLEILMERMEEGAFKTALKDIREQISSGSTLSDAFESHGNLFPSVYHSSIRAGEKSGNLSEVITRYVVYAKKISDAKKQVISALIYPALLIVLVIGVIAIMIFQVLPRFAEMYQGFDADLPFITVALINISKFLVSNILFMLIGIAGIVVAWKMWKESEKGRLQHDRMLLKLPLVGRLLQKFILSQMSRTLATLLSGGIPVVYSLQVTSRSISNAFFSSKLTAATERVKEGESLNSALEETKVIDPLVIEMIKVGESTGALDEMLSNVSDFYDEEIETVLTRFVAMFEPVLLVFMAVVVGGVLLSIYLPMFKTITIIN